MFRYAPDSGAKANIAGLPRWARKRHWRWVADYLIYTDITHARFWMEVTPSSYVSP
jgi:hypothetical protein